MAFDSSIVDEFVAESKEHLETIEKDLLELEKQGGVPVPSVIDHLFRAMHSIKGAAGFIGFVKINKLAHTMETMLQMMRNGEITPEAQYVDALLSGVDLLATMLDDAGNSNEMDIEEIHDRLSNLIAQTSSSEIKKEMETNVSMLDDENQKVGFRISEFELNNLPASHNNLFVLKFDLSKLAENNGETPGTLIRNLLSMGLIIDGKLDSPANDLSDTLEDKPLLYHALYSTIMEKELLCKAVNLSEEGVIEVHQEDLQKATASDVVKNEQKPPKTSQPTQEEAELSKEADKTPPPKRPTRIEPKSHEHTDTIRISVDILDELMTLAGELVLVRNQQLLSVDKSDPVSRDISQRLDLVTTEIQASVMRTRMQPIGNVFGKLPRIVRDLSKKLDKKIEITTIGSEVELDKTILELLADPLTHMIRNCCDHGIESPEQRMEAEKNPEGTIQVRAFHEAGHINIEIRDDGKGIDPEAIKKKALQNGMRTEAELAQMNDKEILSLIMLPGFSTAEKISDVSGRGVGMDVVRTSIEQLSGTIDLESTFGEGTSLRLSLPLTLAIIPCLIVESLGLRYAIPQVNLVELVRLYDEDIFHRIECAGNQEVYRLRDHLLPMVRLNEVLQRPEPFNDYILAEITSHYRQLAKKILEEQNAQSLIFSVLKVGARRFGLIVDNVLGTEEIVVKPMHPAVKKLRIYSGATVMGDGKVAMILDIEGLIQHACAETISEPEPELEEKEQAVLKERTQSILLFKSGPQEQFAISLPLIRRIERIPLSQVERVGEKEFVTIDGVSTRILKMEQHLNVSPCPEKDTILLLLPKHIKHPVGILISNVVDVLETEVNLSTDSYMEDGLMGTAVIEDKMTLFIDIYRLVEKAEPDWFIERRKNAPSPQERKRILLVEDTVFFQQLVKGYLEADGYEVFTAENGKRALEVLHDTTVDLIVSDIEMPIMNGWTFMKAVRAEEALQTIPSLALTSLDSEIDKERTYEAGFNGHETKIEREQLLVRVAELMQIQMAA